MARGYIISQNLDHRAYNDRFFTRQQIIAQALITIIHYYSVTNDYVSFYNDREGPRRMMADGYNAKRSGERFQHSPSNPTAAYPRSLVAISGIITWRTECSSTE